MGRPIYFRGTRQQLYNLVNDLIDMMVGKKPDPYGIARGVFLSMGFVCLGLVKQDFDRKSQGGVGDDGERWPPLSPKYLAYQRRFGPGEKAALKAQAGLGKGHKYAPQSGKLGVLTTTQKKRWWSLYKQFKARFLLSLPLKQAKSRAAACAWNKLKAEGAQTALQVYGHRKVSILKNFGILYNSLSQGQISGIGAGASYKKPGGLGGEKQIFEALRNGIIIGTNVDGAGALNAGSTKKNIPKRQFLPPRIPDKWWVPILDIGQQGIEIGLRLLVKERGH